MDEEMLGSRMVEERSEEESEIDTDFELDDDIKQSLKSLMNIPLEFMDDSGEEEEGPRDATRGDSVERQLEALFVEDPGGGGKEDTGLENISDNEFDGPESGECDTSDGELPDSPNVLVTLPEVTNLSGMDDVSDCEDSDVELLVEYKNTGQKTKEREVVTESSETHKSKDKKEKDPSKPKGKTVGTSKNKGKKVKKKSGSEANDDDLKKKLKFKKYLTRLNQYRAKCMEYMNEISKKCDIMKKDENDKNFYKKRKIKSIVGRHNTKLKSVVEKVPGRERDCSPQSSTSSKSRSSKLEKVLHGCLYETTKRRPGYSEKDKKSKSDKKYKKSKEVKEYRLKYQQYIQYLQSERAKCYEEKIALDRHKIKSKRKHKKTEPASPEKTAVFERKENRPPVLSFADFCNSRELHSPDKELLRMSTDVTVEGRADERKERTISVDSVMTTSTATSEMEHVDDDKELFITYSDLVEQDKLKQNTALEEDREKIENILDKDPELKSISVFTSVLFKGSTDASGIPFLQEGRPPSPKAEPVKPRSTFVQSTGPDEIYDWNDDLSTISQSSFSPSRSPVPKVHNKALLNFLENQKEHLETRKARAALKKSKSSRSRSKSPRKDRSKKRKSKQKSSVSITPSPPPPKARSPEGFKKKPSPPAYLKERWRDYPSPPERRREHYERIPRTRRRSRSRTRSRASHRSRSSSEERHSHYNRRYRSRSPPIAMVQISAAEKRRKLKEEHERALASLRATIRKPLSTAPLSITFSTDGDNYEPVRDNYDPVVMNEVHPQFYRGPRPPSYHLHPGPRTRPFLSSLSSGYYPSYSYY